MEKYEILANKEQLKSFGITYEITGLIGILKQKYPTGWYELKVEHTYNSMTFTNNFDIPKSFLKQVVN